MQNSYESIAGSTRIAEAQDAARFHRIVGATGALFAALGIALAFSPASFANEASVPAAQNPNRQVITPTARAKPLLWKERWRESIIGAARARYCDREMGEQVGWLMSPLLNGFYYGYLATSDTMWIDRLVDWTDSWIKRGVTEPDGFVGWPKVGATGTDIDNFGSYNADSLAGEAMALRPVVLMSAVILKDPALKARYGQKAEGYLKLARSIYEKWDQRGAWRPSGDDGEISVVLPFGLDGKTGRWTEGYQERNAPGQGFSHPTHKANYVASWLLAMSDATGDRSYRVRAEKWFRVMKSRMKPQDDGTFQIWNYWEPAGAWDFRSNGAPKHWVGVHPKISEALAIVEVLAIVEAYEHGLVFTADDIARLVKTALVAGRNWPALAPYDRTLQARFEESLKPDGWPELTLVPWYLSLQKHQAQRNGAPRLER